MITIDSDGAAELKSARRLETIRILGVDQRSSGCGLIGKFTRRYMNWGSILLDLLQVVPVDFNEDLTSLALNILKGKSHIKMSKKVLRTLSNEIADGKSLLAPSSSGSFRGGMIICRPGKSV